jgi:hypothetical protein
LGDERLEWVQLAKTMRYGKFLVAGQAANMGVKGAEP